MTTIGAAWLKEKENNDGSKEFHYSLSFDDAIQPFTITKDKRFTLKPNKNKGNNDKAPDFYIDVFIPDASKVKKDNENGKEREANA